MDHRALAVCRISFRVMVGGKSGYMQQEAVNKESIAHTTTTGGTYLRIAIQVAGGEVRYDIVIETKMCVR